MPVELIYDQQNLLSLVAPETVDVTIDGPKKFSKKQQKILRISRFILI